MRRRTLISIATLAVVIGVIFLSDSGLKSQVLHYASAHKLSELQAAVRRLGVWGPVIVIALMIVHSVTFVPAEVLTLADVALFGPVWGVVYAWIGSMLGAYLAFSLARVIGRPIVERFVPRSVIAWLDDFMRREGRRGALTLRLIPLVSFNAINYASGLVGMNWWDFTWTTGIGILPATLLVAILYHSAMGEKYAFAGLTAAGIAMLVGIILRVRLKRKMRETADHVTNDSR